MTSTEPPCCADHPIHCSSCGDESTLCQIHWDLYVGYSFSSKYYMCTNCENAENEANGSLYDWESHD